MGRFRVDCIVFPTEDPEKVSAAISNLFPGAELRVRNDRVDGSFDDIENLARLVTDQKTRYAFLDAIYRGCRGDSFSVELNKQAASVSRVNVVDEPKPLGSLHFSGELAEPVSFFEKMLDITGYLTSRSERRNNRESEGDTSGRSVE